MAIPMKRMPTVMGPGHSFARVPSATIPRAVFDRSHAYKTTLEAGFLVPVLVDEVLPGDTFTVKLSAQARLTTPIKPLMDNMYMDSFFFFVPYRLVWTNFVKFMGEQDNPGDSIAFTIPQINLAATQYAGHSIADYMGLNTAQNVSGTFSHSALPIRAFWLIYNQWFRDENLISTHPVSLGNGPDSNSEANVSPPKRGKRYDYFTSCLPFLQKGTAVSLPLGTSAVVHVPGSTGGPVDVFADGAAGYRRMDASTASVQISGTVGASGTAMYADLSTATSANINDLRLASQVQVLLERDARGGTRYIELIFAHFKVRSDDARLQRSEYLGGGSTPVIIAPVAQTTQTGVTGGGTPLANLAAIGAVNLSGHGFTKSFTEHGVIIGIVNVRADLTYQQGMERFWSRSTRYDFYWPALAEIGEQSVPTKEIYLVGAAGDNVVFGYQERYAEYRYKPSKITGLLKSQAAGSLEVWHLSEKFASPPVLGQTFIEDQTESILDTRVAVNTEPDFYFDGWFDMKCARPMPVYGVPRLGSRF